MKRIWTFLLFLASTAVFLIACSSNQAPGTAAATEPSTTAATAVSDESTPSTTSDGNLSLIGQTGRAQFLNAYASW